MTDDFDISDLDPIEIPHDFVIELHHLVVSNHRLVLKAINEEEDVELATADLQNPEDFETQQAISNSLQVFYSDLRRAANNLAAVALVTRVQHWMNKFADRLKVEEDRGLVRAFRVLAAKVGNGPVPIDFFEKLVTVRDSIIHGDSHKNWQFNGRPRTVAPEYVNAYDETEISEDQLKEAIDKSIEQVEWFDKRLEESCATQGKNLSQE